MKELNHKCLLTLLFSLGVVCCFSQNKKEIKLNNIKAESRSIVGNNVVVFFLAETEQSESGGLEFSIKLTNESNKNITLANPLDYLQIILLDPEGINLSIPRLPKALINRRENTEDESFVVKKATLNSKILNSDISTKDEITIPAKSSLEITLQIREVIATKDGKILPNADHIKITPGDYRLGITLSLLGKDVVSQIFQADPINIIYKRN